jgi:hypothetical protein
MVSDTENRAIALKFVRLKSFLWVTTGERDTHLPK